MKTSSVATDFDLVVVGGGLAGLTAALYGARCGLHTVLVEPMLSGGQVFNVEKIENFPGFPQGISGFDLGPLVQEQAEAAGAEFTLDAARGLEVLDDARVIHCETANLSARCIIVATGSSLRTLGVPGEAEFVGRGVSHCASCDAPFHVGKSVCVVGGGDSALDEAAVLAPAVGHVTVIHRGPGFTAQQAAISRLERYSNVETLFNTEVLSISGANTVAGVEVRSGGVTRMLDVSGVFIFVGLEPNTAWLQGIVELDPAGHVVVDQHLQSSVPGVFAAGDIRQASSRQLVAAAGDGATAALAAANWLARQPPGGS